MKTSNGPQPWAQLSEPLANAASEAHPLGTTEKFWTRVQVRGFHMIKDQKIILMI